MLCMNLRYIGAMMLVVRALVAGLDLIVRPASGHPLSDVKQPLRFAAMVPLQVYNTLRIRPMKRRMGCLPFSQGSFGSLGSRPCLGPGWDSRRLLLTFTFRPAGAGECPSPARLIFLISEIEIAS